MGAAATLSSPALAVEPGGEVTAELTVRNVGTVVDQFTFELHGDRAEWLSVEPPSVSLLPGGEGTVVLKAAPPRSPDVPAGSVSFGVRVVSSEDPEGSVVEEGTLEVGVYTDLAAELLPRTSRARRRTRHQIAVDNRGNGRVNATLAAVDTNEQLKFEVAPPALPTEPGTATFAKLVVGPRKRFWRGSPKTHPFQVLVQPEQGEPLTLDGTMLQEAVLPRWFFKALLALILLAILLFALWQTLLKPTLENAARSAAEEAAEEVAEEQNEAIEEALAQSAEAQETAEAAATDAAAAEETATGQEEAATAAAESAVEEATAGLRDLGDPFDFRLTRSVAPGATVTEQFEVPEDQVLSLTDIVLQNPGADQGIIRVQRGADAVLIEVRMENFRDLDYHFVSPVVFTAGQLVVFSVQCENPDDRACNPGAYFNGFTKAVPEPAEDS